jgi:hypothetical protein
MRGWGLSFEVGLKYKEYLYKKCAAHCVATSPNGVYFSKDILLGV